MVLVCIRMLIPVSSIWLSCKTIESCRRYNLVVLFFFPLFQEPVASFLYRFRYWKFDLFSWDAFRVFFGGSRMSDEFDLFSFYLAADKKIHMVKFKIIGNFKNWGFIVVCLIAWIILLCTALWLCSFCMFWSNYCMTDFSEDLLISIFLCHLLNEFSTS